ncbi:SDR family NAD(P)-dependent oxidoreductase [Microlunatus soli]|uniref:Short-chain dehydrogenase n=1 Tax=Microlunatus soli TaxID=630515 RepID=A0A1H1N367_9ACTN|nr:SDR family oxidoreductase [Microlunatus soli]SDR93357.1 Short-chain dehydrogenase [Microlunatus soli]
MEDQDRRPIALVAGGSRGLGLAIARELDRAGQRVVITARTADDLRRARDQLAADGGSVITRVHDVRDAAGARDLVAEIESEHGAVETLICVAGVLKVGPLPDRAEDYDEPIDTMLRGPINLVHAVLPRMRQRGAGRIGIVTSIAAVVPTPHLVPYTAAKYGAIGFAQGLTEELRGEPISVTTIVPGLMRTGGHWHAAYDGRPEQEYRWFALLSSLPIVSIAADRAAAIIVRAVLTGRSKIIFTPLARAGAMAYRISPRATVALLGAASRLLPGPGDDHAPGYLAADAIDSSLYDRATVLGRRAIERLNQLGAHASGMQTGERVRKEHD